MRFGTMIRVAVVGLLAAATATLPAEAAASGTSSPTAQKIADHFSSVATMRGSFVQFDADGRKSSGTFSIQRPGRIRFDYAGSPLRVIADGTQVAVNNRKLNTWDLYPLSKTPLKLLLGGTIDLSAANVRKVEKGPDTTTIALGDRSVFGNSLITIVFDSMTYDVRQWTIRDGRGRDTTVVVDGTTAVGRIDPKLFEIPYQAISMGRTESRR